MQRGTATPRTVALFGWLLRHYPKFLLKHKLVRQLLRPRIKGRGYQVEVALANDPSLKIRCDLDDWIPWNVFAYGRYYKERKYEKVLLGLCRNARTVIDVGANIGYYSLQCARLVQFNNGTVHSFEPMSYQFQELQKNVQLNQLCNITLNKRIVSDGKAERLQVFFGGMANTGNSSVEIPTESSEWVDCVSLDHYCEEHRLAQVDLVKIDVEGHEAKVLHGMSLLLTEQRVKHLLVELNSASGHNAVNHNLDIVAWMKQHGYTAHSIFRGAVEPYREGKHQSLVLFSAS